MTVLITPWMTAQAVSIEQAILAHFPIDTNYTHLSAEHRFYFGHLGELCLLQVLELYGKAGTYAPRADGKADRYDFLMHGYTGDIRLDVKTSTQPHHKHLLMPLAQFHKKQENNCQYVSVRIKSTTEAEVLGWCTSAMFSLNTGAFIEKVPTMHCPLQNLNPLYQLLNMIQPGQVTVTYPVGI